MYKACRKGYLLNERLKIDWFTECPVTSSVMVLMNMPFPSGQNRQKITVEEFIFSAVSGYVA